MGETSNRFLRRRPARSADQPASPGISRTAGHDAARSGQLAKTVARLKNPPTLELPEYVALCRNLPRPTPEQIAAFCRHVARADRWYERLPWYPPGTGFTFFIDPGAGMAMVGHIDGVQLASVPDRHGVWRAPRRTEDYRRDFGFLAFADPRWAIVLTRPPGGDQLVADAVMPNLSDCNDALIFRVPDEVQRVGTVHLTGIIHDNIDAWMQVWADDCAVDFLEGCHARSVDELRRALESHGDPSPWPAESGGFAHLAKIIWRWHELRRDPSLARPFSDAERQRSSRKWQAKDMELYDLLEPERARQEREMLDACESVVELVWGCDG